MGDLVSAALRGFRLPGGEAGAMAMETAPSPPPLPTLLSGGSATSNSSAEVKRYSNSKSPGNARSRRIKLVCSFGGRILPRPFDRKLRYVGGDIKLVSISRYVDYDAFLQKMMAIYGDGLAVKYQLPDEDLDTLVSVTSDEDLENMMTECDRLDSLQGASKLRVFVFSVKDIVSLERNDNAANFAMSELEYVYAVNAIPVEPRITTRNDSDCRVGQVACNWNVLQRLPPHQESIEASYGGTGFYASEVDSNDGCASSSHPAPFATQHTGPLESMSAVGDDVCVQESGAATCSSTFSHQDPYSLLQFFARSHKQPHFEAPAFVPNLQDSVAKASLKDHLEQTEQMGDRIVSKNRGSQDGGMNLSGITATPSEFCSDEFIQLLKEVKFDRQKAVATNLPGDRGLSPETKLQKPLEANHDRSQAVNTESLAPLLNIDDLERTRLPQEQERKGIISIQFDKSSNFSNLIPDSLRTQAFEPLGNQQLLAACRLRGQSTSAAKQLDESQTAEITPEETKGHALGKDNMVGLLYSDCSSGLYNGNVRKRTNVPIPTSQPCSKEVYDTVFQTCLSAIPLSSPADELPQQVLASDESFADQTLSNDHHLGITSPAAWHSPDPSNVLIHCPDTDALSEMSGDAFSKTHPLGMARMENYDSTGFDDTTGKGDLQEKVSTENSSRRLPPSVSTDSFLAENTLGSNLFSLNILEELDDRHKNIPFPNAVAGLMDFSVDDSKDMPISISQGLQSSISSFSDQAAPSLSYGWTRTTESEHETPSTALLNFGHEKDIGEMVEKEMKIDEQKLYIEEFQPTEDQSLNVASAAETEAISRGLQIIHHCYLEKLMELGSGNFGTVYYGKWRGTDVAIKRIKSSCFAGKPSVRERLIADFWRETCILGQLHHPNVVAFYGVVPDGPDGTLATVTEYMVDGSLKQALQKEDRTLDLRKRLLIAMDVAFGMEYLHGKNVIHFDIKSDNLLVNLRDLQRPICKVADLGLSKVKQQTMVTGGVRGTLPWMAPELLNGSSVSEKVDVYSFGVVLWELLTGEQPYANMHYGEIIGGIMNKTLRPPIPQLCDSEYKSLMERCWYADPSERPTFSDIAKTLRGMEAALSMKSQGQAFS